MTIVLSPETQKLLDQKLKSGEYKSADEVLHAALEALNWTSGESLDEESLDAIDQGEDDLANNRVHDWDKVRDRFKGAFKGK